MEYLTPWCDDEGRVAGLAGDTTQHVASGSELLLNDVALNDTGTYMCTASNSRGSAAAHVTVRVTGWPHALSLTPRL